VASQLRATRHLLVIDSGARDLPDRHELREFLGMVGSGLTLVVITSRDEETALASGTFGAKRYALGPPIGAPAPQPAPSPPPAASPPVVRRPPEPIDEPRTEPVQIVIDPGPTGPEDASRPAGLRYMVAAGITVVAALAAVILMLLQPWQQPPDPEANPATTTTAGPAPTPTADPAWVTAPPAPGVAIVSPTEGQTTKACVDVRGTAERLTADQTVIVAVRKTDSFQGDDFFLTEAELAGSQWSASVNVGTGNFQNYDIYALVADRESAAEAWRVSDGNVTSRAKIAGIRRGANVRIHQSGGCA
jgi:hypothetical protein